MWWILGTVSSFALAFLLLYRMCQNAPDPPPAPAWKDWPLAGWPREPDQMNTECNGLQPANRQPAGRHYDDTH